MGVGHCETLYFNDYFTKEGNGSGHTISKIQGSRLIIAGKCSPDQAE